MGVSSATPLAAAALAMPSPLATPSPLAAPPESSLAAPPVEPDWFVGLTPLQRAPRTATAMGQIVSVLGQPDGAAAAAMAAALLPCRGGYAAGGGALWARAQPLLLPLSFPQFFAASLGRHGQACHIVLWLPPITTARLTTALLASPTHDHAMLAHPSP